MASDLGVWKDRWQDGNTGWRQQGVNETLVKYYSLLKLSTDTAAKQKIFLPLCGSTVDLLYLAKECNLTVVGVEISELAIETFFNDNSLAFTKEGDVYKCTNHDIIIYVEDLFTFQTVKDFDAIWDYASFVAIDPELRPRYLAAVGNLLKKDGVWLLANFDYSLEEKESHRGPPWPIKQEDFVQLVNKCETALSVEEVGSLDCLTGRWKQQGLTYMDLHAWVLKHK
ncbi:hypothetical protein SARC_10907 [Sphaeroforma arctica JP610]|uniref:thiopurine S-methyltransferase n=1 Tax=Sphaeroforma arctica JP610 TaxID=667725 RepID=A0A0L0FJH7_9EUKA|nr:hypothetical protein SARC_10907 [Sphaeroforma arctica JP610]KNC76601.1 hypothetical protein SARC_10907 [Sphaeroforma arctica JP610]|eukprot:XP_014150503.1 hypothetical protein SARC_10907 [Sphaeroforma arctica JP610]